MPKLLNGMWSLEKRLLRWQAKDFMEKVTFKSRRCRSLSLWGELLYFILFLFGPRSCQRVQVSKQSIKKVLVEEYQNSQWLQGSFVWACAHAAPGIFLRSVPNSDIGLWAALLMSLGSLWRPIKLLIDSIIDHVECDASSSVSEGCAFRCFQCDF